MGDADSRPGSDFVRIGRVGKAHGVDGGVYLETPAFPGVLSVGMRLTAGAAELVLTAVAGMPQRPLIHAQGFADREASVALRGAVVWVARAALPELPAGEWYGSDLEGLAVSDGSATIGVIERLVNSPSVDLLEVALSAGGELLVPVVGDAIVEVDLERRVVTVDARFLGLDSA